MSCSAVPLPSPSFGRGKFRWSTGSPLKALPASIAALPLRSARVSVGPPLFARSPRFASALLLLVFAVPKPHDVPLSRLATVFMTTPAQFAPPLPSETIVLRRLTGPVLRLMLLPLGAELWLTVAWRSDRLGSARLGLAPAARRPPPLPVALLLVIVTLLRLPLPDVVAKEYSPPPSRDAGLPLIVPRMRRS